MRNAILFSGNLISNAFSALVAAGVLSNMQGVLGHAAWRWLFWSMLTHLLPSDCHSLTSFPVEGAFTMFLGIVAVFVLPDLPSNSRGFTAEELQVAQLRMMEDIGEADADSEDQGPFDGLWMCLRDPKVYIMMFTFASYVVGLSFNAFFPSLTKTLGYGYVPTLLFSAPPWAFAVIVSLIVCWHADRTQEKVS